MIVRDAEQTVERCIRSALPLISRWTVIDTGSKDRTREIVQETLAGLPGQLLQSEWVGHAHNRTELLAVAGHGADYVLMLDADMELVQEGELPALTADSYLIDVRDRGLVYPLPLLTSTRKPFFYAGVAHSYLACREPDADSERLSQLAILDHGGGGGRPGKIERDAELLAAEVAKNPLDRRSWFYLAQSYRDLDRVHEAIACYRMRASLGGWDEETYNALVEAGGLLCQHVSFHEGAPLLLKAFQLMPGRAEALRDLAGICGSVADKIPYPENDVLFVRPHAYTHRPEPPKREIEVVAPTTPPAKHKKRPRRAYTHRVSAVLITRGNVDLQPVLDSLPFPDVVVWNNADPAREDVKVLGRYLALAEAKNPVVFFQDDDVLFDQHQRLLDEYEPGLVVCNMDPNWVNACGYQDLAMLGAGAVADKELFVPALAAYQEVWPDEDELRIEADFITGTIVPHRKVDLGYIAREFANDADRLYTQPGQTERKNRVRAQARVVRDALAAGRVLSPDLAAIS